MSESESFHDSIYILSLLLNTPYIEEEVVTHERFHHFILLVYDIMTDFQSNFISCSFSWYDHTHSL
jgi:hypothetical protein